MQCSRATHASGARSALPIPGDLRAWDAMITATAMGRCFADLETHVHRRPGIRASPAPQAARRSARTRSSCSCSRGATTIGGSWPSIARRSATCCHSTAPHDPAARSVPAGARRPAASSCSRLAGVAPPSPGCIHARAVRTSRSTADESMQCALGSDARQPLGDRCTTCGVTVSRCAAATEAAGRDGMRSPRRAAGDRRRERPTRCAPPRATAWAWACSRGPRPRGPCRPRRTGRAARRPAAGRPS